jgi:hypothetical protein
MGNVTMLHNGNAGLWLANSVIQKIGVGKASARFKFFELILMSLLTLVSLSTGRVQKHKKKNLHFIFLLHSFFITYVSLFSFFLGSGIILIHLSTC